MKYKSNQDKLPAYYNLDVNNEDDAAWLHDMHKYNWLVPDVARFYRLPIIRHIRAVWIGWRVEAWASRFAEMGIGFGIPNKYDLWVLYGIRRGWC